MFGHSFILTARDVPLFKTFRMAQNSHNLLFNGSAPPGVEHLEHVVFCSLPSGAEFKNEWCYTFAPSVCLHDM